jgi:integrase
MAKIRKRGKTYQIDYTDPTGKRIRQTFKKKKDAEAELGKRVSLIAEHRYLDVKKDYTTTLGEILDKYKENYGSQSIFQTWKVFCIKRFKEYFGVDTRLSNIRYVDLESYRNQLKQTLTRKKTIRTVATINREISCLHHVFTKAVEWDMMERNPFDRGKSLLQKENNQRIRFLTDEEIPRLIAECPRHLKSIVVCALNTGMRKGEILSLQWDQVHHGFIYLQKTKTSNPRQNPINDTLAELFEEIRAEQRQLHLLTPSVFTYRKGDNRPIRNRPPISLVVPGPVGAINGGFVSVLRRAGIHNFKFHDLRHTFASHMVMRGASLKTVQELLGHKTIQMTMRYAHLSEQHKQTAVNLLNGMTKCHKMSQTASYPHVANG